jgi:hypothetical protein
MVAFQNYNIFRVNKKGLCGVVGQKAGAYVPVGYIKHSFYM